MTVCLITCFCGRKDKVERVIRCFLNQDYTGKTYLLLYNNSPVDMDIVDIELPENKKIILVNNHTDSTTGEDYRDVGSIFRDALAAVPADVELINFFDSDDIFLPNHVSEGVKGWKSIFSQQVKGAFYIQAYKPYNSWFVYNDDKPVLAHNNMEPSIFVSKKYIDSIGFHLVSNTYHQKWLEPLQEHKAIYQPEEGTPTLIYNWEKNHGVHKLSGAGDDSYRNFVSHRRASQDYGDCILKPAAPYEVQYYYNLVKTND